MKDCTRYHHSKKKKKLLKITKLHFFTFFEGQKKGPLEKKIVKLFFYVLEPR